MADKLRPGVSVTPEFVTGEAPPANKLNAISVQMLNASEQLEKALGDIHSESFPYSASNLSTLSQVYPRTHKGILITGAVEKRLDIANLARLIGPASHLNPRSLEAQTITESIPIGVYQFELKYVPDDRSAVAFSDLAVFVAGQYFATGNLMATPGDYNVTAKGKVHTVSETDGGTAIYTVTPRLKAGYDSLSASRFNVIPDPHQIAAGGAGIAWGALSAGKRTGTLPTITHQQNNYDGTAIILDATDLNFGQQLKVPRVLSDNWIAGEQIPEGFLFVKNETTGEVYKEAEYFYDTDSTVTIGVTDITTDIDAGHKFSLITVGSNITSAIDDLRVKTHHAHDRTFGEPFVPLGGLIGATQNAGSTGSYIPSQISGNAFPQYLHRDGWTDGVDDTWNDENALRGDLMMANVDLLQGARVGVKGGNSARIRFGTAQGVQDDGAYIYKDSTEILRYNADKDNSLGHMFMLNEDDCVNIKGTGARNQMHLIDTDLRIDGTGGIFGSVGSVKCQPYFGAGVLTGGPFMGNTAYTILDLPSEINDCEKIIGYELMLEDLAPGTGAWYPAGESAWDGPVHTFSIHIDTGGGPTNTHLLRVVFDSTDSSNWFAHTTLNYRIVLWWY